MLIKRSRTLPSEEPKIRNFDQLVKNKKYLATRISPKLILTYVGNLSGQVYLFKSSGLYNGTMNAKSVARLSSWGLVELKEN